jgi:hypothetical protein
VPACPDINLPDIGQTALLANTSPPLSIPLDLPIGGGDNPPTWERFTGLLGSSGGFGNNPDNAYMSARFDAKHGRVLAFRGKAPTFPATFDGQPVMGTGQLRYWSYCTNMQLTLVYACRRDDEVPVETDGTYTVVMSAAGDRPANARPECGMTWLPTGPLATSIVLLRNMLPDASFDEAIQNTEPGTEEATMGAYYPRGTYYNTTADFEALGC